MTSNLIACGTGAAVAAMQVASAAAGSGALDSVPTLGGVGVLVWIVLHQARECDKLREQLREAHRKCGDCRLAKAANDALVEAGKEHFGHDDDGPEKTEGGKK